MNLFNFRIAFYIFIFELVLLAASLANATIGPQISWGLVKTQTPEAWQITEGSSEVIVAVIDTGIDKNHPDLQNSIWENLGEIGLDKNGNNKSTNGIDDDQNGFIDDVYGWNFAKGNSNISDEHGHGTHIAGLIAANGRSPNSVRGMAPKVKLMVLKYFDPAASASSNLDSIVSSINYAIKMKARIINFSGGGLQPSLREERAIRDAQAHQILFVAAAGNEKSNSDIQGYYPADYPLTNILSVTALDPTGQILPSSNFGTKTVDMAAPGENLLSTLPNGQWGTMSGTSQATALVSGAAALLLSLHPDWKEPQKLIKHIVKTGDRDLLLIGKTRFRSKLNTFQALTMSDDSF